MGGISYRWGHGLGESLFTRADGAVGVLKLESPDFQLAVEAVDFHPVFIFAEGEGQALWSAACLGMLGYLEIKGLKARVAIGRQMGMLGLSQASLWDHCEDLQEAHDGGYVVEMKGGRIVMMMVMFL